MNEEERTKLVPIVGDIHQFVELLNSRAFPMSSITHIFLYIYHDLIRSIEPILSSFLLQYPSIVLVSVTYHPQSWTPVEIKNEARLFRSDSIPLSK